MQPTAIHALMAVAFAALTSPALSANEAGTATFTSEGRTYIGQYSATEHALSVEIDGLIYRGHYAAQANDAGAALQSASGARPWGRAFLFASSAKVLQCRLDTDFPQVKGACQAADGRNFDLKMPAKP